MRNLAVIQTVNVRQYAQSNGLELVDFAADEPLDFELPPAYAILGEQSYVLAPLRLQNFCSVAVKLPEAVVRGRNLAVIHKNALLPSGYSHSFNWVEMGGFTLSDDKKSCSWLPTRCIDIQEESEFYVLGITSHFGHFFTDCLDRLLAVEPYCATGAVRYMIDGRPPAQVQQLIGLLGFELPDPRLLVVDREVDYRVRNLHIVTLRSAKPAISIQSFQELRNRVLARFPHPHLSPRSIYVGRKGVQKRRVLNQDDIERNLSTLNFAAFYPEEHSFEEAVEVFRAADIVVLVIGSSKFNVTFCRPGTTVICIAPEGYVERGGAVAVMLRQLCALFRLELCFCSCKIVGTNAGLDSDMVVDMRDLNRALGILGA